MTTPSADKTTTINARIPADLAELLACMAADDDRSLSSMIGVVLKRGAAVLLRDAERFPTAARSSSSGFDPALSPASSIAREGP